MFATQCSKPQRTNAEIGGYTARILPETWVALMPIQTATQTITLHRMPRKKDLGKAQGNLCDSGIYHVLCEQSVIQSRNMSVYEQNGHKQGTDQVAEINKQVVFHKCLKGDLMVEQGK